MKLTEPLTAILYITADKFHMEDLKHVLHLQSVKEGRYNCCTDTFKLLHQQFYHVMASESGLEST